MTNSCSLALGDLTDDDVLDGFIEIGCVGKLFSDGSLIDDNCINLVTHFENQKVYLFQKAYRENDGLYETRLKYDHKCRSNNSQAPIV